jgi:uncharacterized membrane protein YozB (DUF420 family)
LLLIFRKIFLTLLYNTSELSDLFWCNKLIGLLGTNAPIEKDINLIIQVIMFLILILGISYKNKKIFKIHGKLMGFALTLHILSFLIVMLPAFYLSFDYFIMTTSDMRVQITWIHAVTGLIVMILGIFIVGTWLLNTNKIAECFRKKRLMDITVIFWFISLTFGIITYIIFYS